MACQRVFWQPPGESGTSVAAAPGSQFPQLRKFRFIPQPIPELGSERPYSYTKNVGSPPWLGSHSLRTCSSTDNPVSVIDFGCSAFSSVGSGGGLSIYQFIRPLQSFGSGRHSRRSLMARRRPRVNQESLPRASLAGWRSGCFIRQGLDCWRGPTCRSRPPNRGREP
jgi:hypothetical protein